MREILQEMTASKLEQIDFNYLIDFFNYFKKELLSNDGKEWKQLTFKYLMGQFEESNSRKLLCEVFSKVLE